jgi:hypothetical protein
MNQTKQHVLLIEIYDEFDWQKLFECENKIQNHP